MVSITSADMIWFIIGIFMGEVFDLVYDRKINNKEDTFFKKVPALQSLFHWFEHYHWGILSLLVYCPILNGFGLSLILDENRSELGFGYEKDPKKRDEYYHFRESSAIGAIFFVALLAKWFVL